LGYKDNTLLVPNCHPTALAKVSFLLITATPGLDTGEGCLKNTEDADTFFGSAVSSALVGCCTSPVSATLNLEQLAASYHLLRYL
jgi:hypothetical protein